MSYFKTENNSHDNNDDDILSSVFEMVLSQKLDCIKDKLYDVHWLYLYLILSLSYPIHYLVMEESLSNKLYKKTLFLRLETIFLLVLLRK